MAVPGKSHESQASSFKFAERNPGFPRHCLSWAKHSILSILRLHSKFAFGFLLLGTAVNQLPKTITVTPPPMERWSKMKGIFQSLRSGVHNFASGLKHASDVFISSGGGAMVLIEGFKSLINIGKHFYGEWINGMKDAAAMSEQNAAGIREAAQANGWQ